MMELENKIMEEPVHYHTKERDLFNYTPVRYERIPWPNPGKQVFPFEEQKERTGRLGCVETIDDNLIYVSFEKGEAEYLKLDDFNLTNGDLHGVGDYVWVDADKKTIAYDPETTRDRRAKLQKTRDEIRFRVRDNSTQ